jgi:hypothetical protein
MNLEIPQAETMTEAQFAQSMVNRYRKLLLSAAGHKSITIDGQVVSYADLTAEYEKWAKKLARLNGGRPVVVSLDMENAF